MASLYNITFVTSKPREAELLNSIQAEFMPLVMQAGEATCPQITRVAPQSAGTVLMGEEEAVSLCVQFRFEEPRAIAAWREATLEPAFEKVAERFGEDMLHFDTVLDIIEIRNFN